MKIENSTIGIAVITTSEVDRVGCLLKSADFANEIVT